MQTETWRNLLKRHYRMQELAESNTSIIVTPTGEGLRNAVLLTVSDHAAQT